LHNPEGYLEMVNSLLGLALRPTYLAEKAMRFADKKLLTFLWKEIDCAESSFFCGIFVTRQPSECD
jgi:hypothetical protein